MPRMTTRTNVGAALAAVEENITEIIRRLNQQQQQIDKLTEIADIASQAHAGLASLVENQTKEILRISDDLDQAYTDLDALTTPEA